MSQAELEAEDGGSREGEPGPEEAGGARSETDGDGDAPARCEICGGPVLERHCKITCLNCGFQRDCSDP